LNPVEVTNKSKSKQNHKACFFDFVFFDFQSRTLSGKKKSILSRPLFNKKHQPKAGVLFYNGAQKI